MPKLHGITLGENIENPLAYVLGETLLLHFGVELFLSEPLGGKPEFALQECHDVFSEPGE